jgi:cholestenol delta-isomerase
MATALNHPFYPLDLNPIGYVSNTMSITALLGTFTVAVAGVIVFTSAVLKAAKPNLSRTDKILVGWFVFSETYWFHCCLIGQS